MKAIRNLILAIFHAAYRILLGYSEYVLLVIVGVVTCDVIGRNLLGGSVMWAQEISLLLIVWMCFVSMAVGVERHTHISIEVFYMMFPKKMQKFLDILNQIIFFFVGIFFTYYGSLLVMNTWTSTLPASKLPAGVLYLMIPVGGFCIALFTLMNLLGLGKYKHVEKYDPDYKESEEEKKELP